MFSLKSDQGTEKCCTQTRCPPQDEACENLAMQQTSKHCDVLLAAFADGMQGFKCNWVCVIKLERKPGSSVRCQAIGLFVGFIIYLNRIQYCTVSLLKFKSKYWLNYAVLKAVRETIAMPQSGAFHNNLHPEGNQSEMTLIVFQLSFLVETGTKKRKTKHSDVGVSKHLLTSFQVRKERMFLLLCPSPTCRSAALGSHRGRCQATKATLFILIRGT